MNYLPHFNGKVQEIRAMGYDFLGSLLELTDNSARKNIQSKNISVILHKDDDNRLSRVSVIDDGLGMNMNSLCTAFIFNLLKEREEGDIGKFHVGMKYAAIVIGSDITILSKSPGSPVVGLWANIETMKALDTFTPTEVCDDVSDSWALRHVHPADYAKFKGSSSGTIISITNMTPMCRAVYSKVSDELKKSLPNSYVSLYNGCLLHLYSNEELLLTVKPNNLFYVGEEELLDEPAYSTVLSVYRDSLGNERLIEMNTESRFMANGSKKKTVGSVQKPVYYEFTHYTTDKGFLRTMMAEVDARLLPDASTLIDTLKMRIIQVKDSVFKSERALFTDLSKLQADRKGFYFNREIRIFVELEVKALWIRL